MFAANVIVANAAWYIFLRRPERSARIRRHPFWRAYLPLMRLLWFVGVPYGALLSGVLTPEQFGLALPDWRQAIVDTGPIVLGALLLGGLLLAPMALLARRNITGIVYPAVLSRALLSRPWGFAFVVIESLCLQAQWTFYRTAALDYFGEARTAAGIALALIVVGWVLDPRWRDEVGRTGSAEDHYIIAALAIVGMLIYLSVPNFWLLWATQIFLWFGWLALLIVLCSPARQPPRRTTVKKE